MSVDFSRCTAVILAAGEGTRLAPRVERFHKPLLYVDGVPLIQHAAGFALEAGCFRTVVVVSPNNAMSLAPLVPHADFVVQAIPRGPNDALDVGLRAVLTPWTLLLTADNTFAPDGAWFASIVSSYMGNHAAAIAVSRYDPAKSARFSYVEGRRLRPRESARVREDLDCWVGPLLGHTGRLRASYDGTFEDRLNQAGPFGLVPMQCEDHGVIA